MGSMADPLRITPGEMYALAAFCILEGDNTLSDTHEQLKVAAVLVNRMNASNWTREFGRGVFNQLFARNQFEVQTRYRLDREDFDSLDEASQALADAKSGLSKPWSRERIIAFIRAAGDTEQYTRAAGDVGDNTGFRGAGGRNTFRKESPYDDRNIGSKQPSSVVVDWPGGRAPF
jgi:hypothetical protein